MDFPNSGRTSGRPPLINSPNSLAGRALRFNNLAPPESPSAPNPPLGAGGRCDKTVCQYCGVSYLTISEMRTLQSTVREQEQRLAMFKETVQENSRLRDTLANIRKTHLVELSKQEEQTQRAKARCNVAENQLEILKRDFRDASKKKTDITEKYAIASEDYKQQEEIICQLREQLQEKRDSECENVMLKQKLRALEASLQHIITHPQYKDILASDKGGGQQGQKTEDKVGKTKQGHLYFFPDKMEVIQSGVKQKTQAQTLKSPESERASQKSKQSSLASVEVHDLRRQNASLLERVRSLTEEHTGCTGMHGFLRETVDKLKSENIRLHEETNGLRVQFEESVLNIENLEAQHQGLSQENDRLRGSGKELEAQLRTLIDQNRAIKSSIDPKLVDQLQKSLLTLQRQCQAQKEDLDSSRAEFEERLSAAQRETQMEKERADSCLTSSFAEREEVEKRWEERWTRHQTSLNEQLESLKTNYEKSLTTAKEHEDALQKEVRVLKEKIEKSKAAWEEYRMSLNEQINHWKNRYEQKHHQVDSIQKSKVEVEVLYQQKSAEMDKLHEMVREGCEERQELQKRLENMEENFEEVRLQTGSSGRYYFGSKRTSAFGDSGSDVGYHSYSEVKPKGGPMGGTEPGTTRLKTSTSEGQLPGTSRVHLARLPPIPHPAPGLISLFPYTSNTSDSDAADRVFTIGKGKVSGSGRGALTTKKKKPEPGKGSDLETRPKK